MARKTNKSAKKSAEVRVDNRTERRIGSVKIKLYSLIFLLLISLGVKSQNVGYELGLFGGVGFGRHTPHNMEDVSVFKGRLYPSYHGGLSIKLNVSIAFVETQITYNHYLAKANYRNTTTVEINNGQLSIPILIGVRLWQYLKIFGGVSASYNTSLTIDGDKIFRNKMFPTSKTISTNWIVGLGVVYRRLSLDIRYLGNMSKLLIDEPKKSGFKLGYVQALLGFKIFGGGKQVLQ